MAEFSYRNNKVSWKELLVFIVVESLVVVWGSGAWIAFENPYQRTAIVYAMASVALELILHVSKLAFIILGWDK